MLFRHSTNILLLFPVHPLLCPTEGKQKGGRSRTEGKERELRRAARGNVRAGDSRQKNGTTVARAAHFVAMAMLPGSAKSVLPVPLTKTQT
ncbi:unnamed protein product [Arctogadus glacialis]